MTRRQLSQALIEGDTTTAGASASPQLLHLLQIAALGVCLKVGERSRSSRRVAAVAEVVVVVVTFARSPGSLGNHKVNNVGVVVVLLVRLVTRLRSVSGVGLCLCVWNRDWLGKCIGRQLE